MNETERRKKWALEFSTGVPGLSGTYGPFNAREDAEAVSQLLARTSSEMGWDSSSDFNSMLDPTDLLKIAAVAS